jgi:alanine-glyoxylate transaminase/serine-glyoxylate transaminase/serine-pyruvate transaminase
VLRAIDRATIDHRGPEFQKLGQEVLAGLEAGFKTKAGRHLPASGTGAWEAALVNTLSPGDRVLMYETGHFATLWNGMATRLGVKPEFIASDWRRGADPAALEAKLAEDRASRDQGGVRRAQRDFDGCDEPHRRNPQAIDRAKHPALYMVDTISSLASIDYRHDEWGVDVTVAGSQKGLMLPPGLSFNAVSDKRSPPASRRSSRARTGRGRRCSGRTRTASSVHARDEPALRPARSAEDARRRRRPRERVQAPRPPRRSDAARGARVGPRDPLPEPGEYSSVADRGADARRHSEVEFRKVVLEHYNMSLGSGLGKIANKVFRIGHLGDFNDLTLLGTLCGVEMGLRLAGVPHQKGGVDAAMDYSCAGQQTGA